MFSLFFFFYSFISLLHFWVCRVPYPKSFPLTLFLVFHPLCSLLTPLNLHPNPYSHTGFLTLPQPSPFLSFTSIALLPLLQFSFFLSIFTPPCYLSLFLTVLYFSLPNFSCRRDFFPSTFPILSLQPPFPLVLFHSVYFQSRFPPLTFLKLPLPSTPGLPAVLLHCSFPSFISVPSLNFSPKPVFFHHLPSLPSYGHNLT